MWGWCDRHQIRKSPRQHHQCQHNEEHRKFMDERTELKAANKDTYVAPPCECDGPGICTRFAKTTSANEYRRCKENDEYRTKLEIKKIQKQFQQDETALTKEEKAQRREEMPSVVAQGFSFLDAATKYVEDLATAQGATVNKEEYMERITICDTCDKRSGNKCKACGCNLVVKVGWARQKCPLDKW